MSFKYPDPPEYYKKFEAAPDALERPDLDKIKEKNSEYFVFGMRRQFQEEIVRIDIADLRLVPAPIGDYREELKKLNHSLLAKILEYFQLAAANQNDGLNQTLSDIHKLAGNFFYVLNTLKDGVKAKKDLINMREKQQESFEDQTNHIRQALSAISSQLGDLSSKFNEGNLNN